MDLLEKSISWKKIKLNQSRLLPEWVEFKLQEADSEQLEGWVYRVLEAGTLKDVFVEQGDGDGQFGNIT
ncbi:MAG TPA: hypothetical protein P5102_05210 [Candidatus Competibacteraceae bacterium]|nr:hypothetical protein [Candidatus Competibacteraceae bacterium]